MRRKKLKVSCKLVTSVVPYEDEKSNRGKKISLFIFLFFVFFVFLFGDIYPNQNNFVSDMYKINYHCNKYKRFISKELSKYDNSPFDVSLICSLIFVESSFNSKAASRFKALGLMQITPLVVIDYQNITKDPIKVSDRAIDRYNIRLGIWYLHHLFNRLKDKYDNDVYHIVLTSYWMGISKAKFRNMVKSSYSMKIQDLYILMTAKFSLDFASKFFLNPLSFFYNSCFKPFYSYFINNSQCIVVPNIVVQRS